MSRPTLRFLVEAIRRNVPWTVTSVEQKPGVERPAPPFTTSTLTQEASRKLGFSTERTMQAAQRLFQGVDIGNGEMEGLITYHRTDSTTLSDKALNESARVIREMFGGEYYDEPRRYQTRVKNAQEAHEAIRPSDFRLAPSQLERVLDPDDFKIYDLIWKRTMASQMVDARVLRTTIEISAQGPTAKCGADRERQGDRVCRVPPRVRRGQRRSGGGARGAGSDSAAVQGRRSRSHGRHHRL